MGLVQRFEGAARDTGESHERNRHPHRQELPAKPIYIVAVVSVAAFVVMIALAIGVWATGDGGGSTTPTCGNVVSTQQPVQSLNALSPELQSVDVWPAPQSPQSVNALSPELPASAIAHWSQAEGLTGLPRGRSINQSTSRRPRSPRRASTHSARSCSRSTSPRPRFTQTQSPVWSTPPNVA